MFVCKAWTKLALEEYYQEVCLSADKVIFLKPKLLQSYEDQDQQHVYGHWTRKLRVCSSTYGRPSRQYNPEILTP
jgi:hypothetical protein